MVTILCTNFKDTAQKMKFPLRIHYKLLVAISLILSQVIRFKSLSQASMAYKLFECCCF